MLWLVKILNPFRGIAGKLADAYTAKANAETEQQRIEADIQITQLTARQKVLIAEQQNPVTRLIRPLWALPFVVYAWKVIVWDMTLGLGTTPPLGDQMFDLMTVIAGAYFLTRGAEKIVKTYRRARP